MQGTTATWQLIHPSLSSLAFRKPAKFSLLIGVVLLKYVDYFLVCMNSMIGYFSNLGPRYCMIKPYAEVSATTRSRVSVLTFCSLSCCLNHLHSPQAYDPEMEYGDEADMGRGPHSDLPDNLKQIAERADRGY